MNVFSMNVFFDEWVFDEFVLLMNVLFDECDFSMNAFFDEWGFDECVHFVHFYRCVKYSDYFFHFVSSSRPRKEKERKTQFGQASQANNKQSPSKLFMNILFPPSS